MKGAGRRVNSAGMQFDDSKAGAFRLPFGCLSDVFHNGRRLGTQPPVITHSVVQKLSQRALTQCSGLCLKQPPYWPA